MEGLWQWGITVIVAMQRAGQPVMRPVFLAFTYLGEEQFYFLLLPLLLWCVDPALGVRLSVVFLFSIHFNTSLKDLLAQPRPYDLRPEIRLSAAHGYGLPSGHAQSAVVVWGVLAGAIRRRWAWAAAALLALLIGLSRVYLGVHFPTDVLAGWGIGVAVLGLYLAVGGHVERWLSSCRLREQLVMAVAVPFALFVLHPAKDTTSTMGALAGLGVGVSLSRRYLPVAGSGPRWHCMLRFLAGGTLVLAVYFALRLLIPGEGSSHYLYSRFLRYLAVGLTMSLGAPWLFLRLGLAGKTADGD